MMVEEETTTRKTELEHNKTIFDGWRSISIALYMALLGYGVSVGLPVISSAWVSLLGFTEVEVGRIASADLGGLALGALITSQLIVRMNRRMLALIGITLAVVGNGLCMVFLEYDQTLLLRLIAGTGSGIYTALAIATLGGTSRPARAFSLLLFAFAFTQAGEMQVLPQLSMNGIYGLFIAMYLISALFLSWLPPYAVKDLKDIELDVTDEKGEHHHLVKHIPSYVPWLCLGAIVFIYIAIGAYWTYIELASLKASIEKDWINSVLVWGSFMSILGVLFATVISDRIGLSKPLLFSLTAMALTISIMAGNIINISLLISVILFNFLWFFIDVYQMGSMSIFDPSGKYVSLVVGAQGVGQIIGPNLAASLLSYQLGYDAVFIMCACSALIAMLIYGIMYVKLRKTIPALADAS